MPLPFPPNHEVYMRYGATMRNGAHRGNGIPFPRLRIQEAEAKFVIKL